LLTLAGVRHLSRGAMASVSQQIMAMDRRAFRISKVYRVTGTAVQGG
jgi:hypothetical protein